MKHEPDSERREYQKPQAKIENEPRVSLTPPGVDEKGHRQDRAGDSDPISDVEVLPDQVIGVKCARSEMPRRQPYDPQHREQQRHDSKAERCLLEQILGELPWAAKRARKIRRRRRRRRCDQPVLVHHGWGAPAVRARVNRSAWVALSVRKTAARFPEWTNVGEKNGHGFFAPRGAAEIVSIFATSAASVDSLG